MSDDNCQHRWGDTPEEVETPLGTLHSPLCIHCGAVKLIEENRAADRRRAELALRTPNFPPAAKPVATNIPPPGALRVHPFQTEIFPDS